MSELKRINGLTAQLKPRLAVGGMTYNEAVTVDHLISVFERMIAELETGRLIIQRFQKPLSRSTSKGE